MIFFIAAVVAGCNATAIDISAFEHRPRSPLTMVDKARFQRNVHDRASSNCVSPMLAWQTMGFLCR